MMQPRLRVEWDRKLRKWRLTAPMYAISKTYGVIEVPAGAITNLSNDRYIPLLNLLFIDRMVEASAVHDYAYDSKLWSRKVADHIFYEILRDTGHARWRCIVAYSAVRLFGWINWYKLLGD